MRFVSGTDRRTDSPWETAALHRVPYTVWERRSLEVVTERLAGYPTLAGWRGETLRDDDVIPELIVEAMPKETYVVAP